MSVSDSFNTAQHNVCLFSILAKLKQLVSSHLEPVDTVSANMWQILPGWTGQWRSPAGTWELHMTWRSNHMGSERHLQEKTPLYWRLCSSDAIRLKVLSQAWFLTKIKSFHSHLLHFCSTSKETATRFPSQPHNQRQPGHILFYWPTDPVPALFGPCWKQRCCWMEISSKRFVDLQNISRDSLSLQLGWNQFLVAREKQKKNSRLWAELSVDLFICRGWLRLVSWAAIWAPAKKLTFYFR